MGCLQTNSFSVHCEFQPVNKMPYFNCNNARVNNKIYDQTTIIFTIKI